MKIFVSANEQQQNELRSFKADQKNELLFSIDNPKAEDYKYYDVFFIFSNSWKELDFQNFVSKPVFINMVVETLFDYDFQANVNRINGWPGFIKNPLWEIVSSEPERVKDIFKSLNRKVTFVDDEPGFVSARVISMIINEAFFTLGQNISSMEEIDVAMKSGTNYPQGPFEWAKETGIENIYHLLEKLSRKDDRYLPAPALHKHYLERYEMLIYNK
ncbi:MAG TPA: 3-hydroxyacyl-CoA dehydrogenase family protein [Hanamia sp.]